MVLVILTVLGGLFTFIGAWLYHQAGKEVKKLRSQQKELESKPKDIEDKPLGPYVKIGKVDATFNKDLHECKLPTVDMYRDETSGWDIGTVIACTQPECGQEWVLGYYVEAPEEKMARIDITNAAYEKSMERGYYSRALHVSDGMFYTEAYLPPIVPQEVKKKWYTMEEYEKDPDRYVYFV
jgi:hypothetical protein